MTTDEQTTVYVTSMLGCWDISGLSSYALFTSTSRISTPEKPRSVVHGMHWSITRAIIITKTVWRRWM